jgi:MerR family transcriptional regulator/heat shock protein HspR
MDEQSVTRIEIRHTRTSSLYTELETANVSHMGIGAIRHLHALGLIEGEETGGELHYSEEEVTQLRRIRRLQRDLGINLAGVEVILHLLKRLDAVYKELEQERNRARTRDETL